MQGLTEELHKARHRIELREHELVKTHALVDTLEVGNHEAGEPRGCGRGTVAARQDADGMPANQVKLKVAIRSHEADVRQLHHRIECLCDNQSKSSSAASPGSCHQLHLDLEVCSSCPTWPSGPQPLALPPRYSQAACAGRTRECCCRAVRRSFQRAQKRRRRPLVAASHSMTPPSGTRTWAQSEEPNSLAAAGRPRPRPRSSHTPATEGCKVSARWARRSRPRSRWRMITTRWIACCTLRVRGQRDSRDSPQDALGVLYLDEPSRARIFPSAERHTSMLLLRAVKRQNIIVPSQIFGVGCLVGGVLGLGQEARLSTPLRASTLPVSSVAVRRLSRPSSCLSSLGAPRARRLAAPHSQGPGMRPHMSRPSSHHFFFRLSRALTWASE